VKVLLKQSSTPRKYRAGRVARVVDHLPSKLRECEALVQTLQKRGVGIIQIESSNGQRQFMLGYFVLKITIINKGKNKQAKSRVEEALGHTLPL
jgi:hypothetical protein